MARKKERSLVRFSGFFLLRECLHLVRQSVGRSQVAVFKEVMLDGNGDGDGEGYMFEPMDWLYWTWRLGTSTRYGMYHFSHRPAASAKSHSSTPQLPHNQAGG